MTPVRTPVRTETPPEAIPVATQTVTVTPNGPPVATQTVAVTPEAIPIATGPVVATGMILSTPDRIPLATGTAGPVRPATGTGTGTAAATRDGVPVATGAATHEGLEKATRVPTSTRFPSTRSAAAGGEFRPTDPLHRSVPPGEVARENARGTAPSGSDIGLIVGPLIAGLVLLVGLFFLILFIRRRKAGEISMSPDGNEMSFDTERHSTEETTIWYEDELSGAGSQYQNLSETEAGVIDGMNGLQDGSGFEEGLFEF
jgi:hypothetical protein